MIDKLLVVTQKVDQDDEGLGFFFGWLEELAKHCDELTVICLERGAGSLPANVRVFSLGKESRRSRLRYILNFYKYIFSQWNNYDTVFVHMNQEYVLLAGILWRLGGKKVSLWRNHARGSWLTSVAVFLSNQVFCTSPHSFTARFRKTRLMPVGVDTALFKPNSAVSPTPRSILFLSRIATVKRPELLIDALGKLDADRVAFSASFYGDAAPKDEKYYQSLKTRVAELGLANKVFFYSGVPNRQTPPVYHAHEIFVNLTPAGSFDKTIVEALACGALILTANTDLTGALPEELILKDSDSLAERIIWLLQLPSKEKKVLLDRCSTFVQRHSLATLMQKLELDLPNNSLKSRIRLIVRFVFSGGIGAVTNVGLLFILVHFFGWWYVAASAVAFVVATIVSFILQKFWTFQERSAAVIHRQFVGFVVIALCNLGLNIGLVYLFTGVLGMWYVLSQILASVLIAVSSFFLYRAFVFSTKIL